MAIGRAVFAVPKMTNDEFRMELSPSIRHSSFSDRPKKKAAGKTCGQFL